jgi:LysM repeat protein
VADPPSMHTSAGPDTGSGLTKKMVGLPMWGWIALAAAGGVVALVWMQNHKSKTTDSSIQTPVDQNPEGLSTDQYESLLALLRDIQGQPSTPLPTPSPGPAGPPGPPGPSGQPPKPPRTPTPTKLQTVTVAEYTTKNPPWNSTLSGIAKHYNTSVSNLMRLNPWIKNPNMIHKGDKVRVK